MRIASLEKCIPSLDAKIQVIDERTQIILNIVNEVKVGFAQTAEASHQLTIKNAEVFQQLAIKNAETIVRMASYERDKERQETENKEIRGKINEVERLALGNQLTMAKYGLLMGGGGLIGALISLIASRLFENLF